MGGTGGAARSLADLLSTETRKVVCAARVVHGPAAALETRLNLTGPQRGRSSGTGRPSPSLWVRRPVARGTGRAWRIRRTDLLAGLASLRRRRAISRNRCRRAGSAARVRATSSARRQLRRVGTPRRNLPCRIGLRRRCPLLARPSRREPDHAFAEVSIGFPAFARRETGESPFRSASRAATSPRDCAPSPGSMRPVCMRLMLTLLALEARRRMGREKV